MSEQNGTKDAFVSAWDTAVEAGISDDPTNGNIPGAAFAQFAADVENLPRRDVKSAASDLFQKAVSDGIPVMGVVQLRAHIDQLQARKAERSNRPLSDVHAERVRILRIALEKAESEAAPVDGYNSDMPDNVELSEALDKRVQRVLKAAPVTVRHTTGQRRSIPEQVREALEATEADKLSYKDIAGHSGTQYPDGDASPGAVQDSLDRDETQKILVSLGWEISDRTDKGNVTHVSRV